MDKRVIKTLIKENQNQISKIKLINRPIQFDENSNYVLVGIRRAGKSFQLYQDIQNKISQKKYSIEDILFINFEDERIAEIKANELGLILECYAELYGDKKPFIYLDEIQNISGWEKFARRIAEQKYRVKITGSNAQMLSKDIATSLGGGYVVREVFPFSFKEYLQWLNIKLTVNWEYDTQTTRKIRRALNDYFKKGGIAEAFQVSNHREWITSLYNKILLGDIVARNGIRNSESIKSLAKKLADNVMQPTTQSRLVNLLKSIGNNISRNTLAEYLSLMNDAYLTFHVSNFTSSFSERIIECKKYFLDNGLLNIFLTDGDTKLLENLVAIDLVCRYRLGETDSVYYYNKNIEVDFYVPEESLAVQVSYSIQDMTTKDREIKALVKLTKAFNVKHTVIITYDEEDTIETEEIKISVIPVWKWLLR